MGSQLPSTPGGTYGLTGAECTVGTASPHTWSGVPDPSGDSTRFLWFLVVATDGAHTEGAWGRNSAGEERTGPGPQGSSGLCGAVAKNTTNPCGLSRPERQGAASFPSYEPGPQSAWVEVSRVLHDYEPYGLEIVPLEPSPNTHRFTGHERDVLEPLSQATLDYMHFRFYAASIGRFQKPDNLWGAPPNPQSWNLYAYVKGNPVTFNDPTGHVVGQAYRYHTWAGGDTAGAKGIHQQANGFGGGIGLGEHPWDQNPMGVIDWAVIDNVVKVNTNWGAWYAMYGMGNQRCSYSNLDCATDGKPTLGDGIDVSYRLTAPPYPKAMAFLITGPDSKKGVSAYAQALKGQLEAQNWTVTIGRTFEEMLGCAERLDLIMHHTEDGVWLSSVDKIDDKSMNGAVFNMVRTGQLSSSGAVYFWGCHSASMVPLLAGWGFPSLGFTGYLWVGSCGATSCSLPVVWP